jgi:hypothetical protein
VNLRSITKNDLENDFDFLAVGLDCADRYPGRIEHAVTYHPREFDDFKKRRAKAGGNLDYATHTHCRPELGHRVWPFEPPSGSSAMLGIEVGIGLGYSRIIVAGVLLEGKVYGRFQKGWVTRYDIIKDKVRAMNGYPREMLGAPDGEWLMVDRIENNRQGIY